MESIGRYMNQSSLRERRRDLRKFQTRAEGILWSKLRREQLGVKFRRQFNIDHFIVDFYCHALKLIIELDGWQHGSPGNQEYDQRRDAYLRAKGYTMLRYQNIQIKYELDAVVQDIMNNVERLLLLEKTPPNLP